MCRNIKPLFNFQPKASHDEIHDAALQYVRKLTGMNKPNDTNQAAFDKAVKEIAHATSNLFGHLETKSEPKNREVEAQKAKLRNEKRFGIKN
jgi:hypothetical protein